MVGVVLSFFLYTAASLAVASPTNGKHSPQGQHGSLPSIKTPPPGSAHALLLYITRHPQYSKAIALSQIRIPRLTSGKGSRSHETPSGDQHSRLYLARSSITRSVATLVGLGLVDRRGDAISLTPFGKRHVSEALAVLSDAYQIRAYRHIPVEELGMFRSLIVGGNRIAKHHVTPHNGTPTLISLLEPVHILRETAVAKTMQSLLYEEAGASDLELELDLVIEQLNKHIRCSGAPLSGGHQIGAFVSAVGEESSLSAIRNSGDLARLLAPLKLGQPRAVNARPILTDLTTHGTIFDDWVVLGQLAKRWRQRLESVDRKTVAVYRDRYVGKTVADICAITLQSRKLEAIFGEIIFDAWRELEELNLTQMNARQK